MAALIVVADALARLNQPSSKGALLQARARVAALSFEDAFMGAVQSDVVVAIDKAMGSLGAP